ncbi:MAG: hypothetical protein AAF841_05960, partial [Pseudomonadota bacterium]
WLKIAFVGKSGFAGTRNSMQGALLRPSGGFAEKLFGHSEMARPLPFPYFIKSRYRASAGCPVAARSRGAMGSVRHDAKKAILRQPKHRSMMDHGSTSERAPNAAHFAAIFRPLFRHNKPKVSA